MAAHASSDVPDWITPILAKPDSGRLRTGLEWAYEYKVDGYRASMRIAPDGNTVLTSRNGINFPSSVTSHPLVDENWPSRRHTVIALSLTKLVVRLLS